MREHGTRQELLDPPGLGSGGPCHNHLRCVRYESTGRDFVQQISLRNSSSSAPIMWRTFLVLAASYLPASNGFAAPAEPPRQRRARYAGKYPKKFEEKHKEQAGDAATIARVLLKGGTPAGSHVPIMATECLAHLGLVEGSTEITTAAPSLGGASEMVAVDCTLGFGGHSGLMLDALSEWAASNDARRAALASFDRDGVELRGARRARATRRILRIPGRRHINQPHQPPHQAHQHTGTGAPGRGFGDG